jgi:hypothetical protein
MLKVPCDKISFIKIKLVSTVSNTCDYVNPEIKDMKSHYP